MIHHSHNARSSIQGLMTIEQMVWNSKLYSREYKYKRMWCACKYVNNVFLLICCEISWNAKMEKSVGHSRQGILCRVYTINTIDLCMLYKCGKK